MFKARERDGSSLCGSCFEDRISKKIKSSLAKALGRPKREATTAVIALSGGPCSSALCIFLSRAWAEVRRRVAMQRGAPLRAVDIRAAVHVVLPGQTEADRSALAAAEAAARMAGVPLRVLRLGETAEEAELIGRLDAREIFMARALTREATSAGAQVLITAESATRLASVAIALTARGRGSKVATAVSLCDSLTWPGLSIIRPLRDVLAEEALDFFSIIAPDFPRPAPASGAAPPTIESVSAEWLASMQSHFDQTVFTVLGSTSRLCAEPGALQCDRCRCFMSQIDREPGSPLCRACRSIFRTGK